MIKNKKVIIIMVLSLIIGVSVCLCVFIVNGFSFNMLNAVEFESKSHEITQAFTDIEIDVSTDDIKIIKSEDGNSKIVCQDSDKITHEVAVQDGKLTIKEKDERKLLDYMALNFQRREIYVYLSESEYKDIIVNVSTGDVVIDGVNFENIKSEGSTGDITIKNLNATASIMVKRSTGSVYFENFDAGEINITVSTGNVTGSLTTEKIFDCQTSTGTISVPESASGGKCKITTSTGDIIITIK